MIMKRRDFVILLGGALVFAKAATAQTYPSRPVRLVVGFPPGGTTDIVGRIIGQCLSERLNASFVVENKPGAATNIAAESVVHAPSDGHTLLLISPANAINTSFYPKQNFDFVHGITPVGTLIRSPYVLEVYPGFPAASVPELISYAKAHPGEVNIASFGTGTASHLSGELFKSMAGVQMQHVPYKGSAPMLTDLLSGRVQVAFDNLPASIQYIKNGQLRALAVTTANRSPMLPDVPALEEILPGFESSSWLAVGAPSNTSPKIISVLNQEINACLTKPAIMAKLADLGATALAGSPADTASLIAAEMEKWRKVIDLPQSGSH
jgi:tripartite-type tricarboxylate transporter receptor subunit TctC